jgi:hypothetical protein
MADERGEDRGRMAIAFDNDRAKRQVIIEFAHETRWIGLSPENARAVAHELLRRADEVGLFIVRKSN